MCIFSGSVHDVSNTKIFCRLQGERQFLVYSMDVAPVDKVAMILPLPTSEQKEDAVEFINLKDHADLFDDLDKPFVMQARSMSRMLGSKSEGVLKVHEVGDFVASFTPAKKDFARLSKRFQLPENVWKKLPQYADFGYVVFQLAEKKLSLSGSGQFLNNISKHYHPMGFSFPTRYPKMLFFPTVHVHDGNVPNEEHFDHSLYFQGDFPNFSMQKSLLPAKDYVKNTVVVDPEALIHKHSIHGNMPNKDIYCTMK